MVGNVDFCLCFKDFQGKSKIYWPELQNEKDFCDVTLVCEDKQIEAHKLVISSHSPVLENILKFNKTFHPVIYLRK